MMANITVCLPAEQDIFFQEMQFDPDLGEGTDPVKFWQGNPLFSSPKPLPPVYGRKTKSDRLKKAEKALEGHENKEEIMKILRSGTYREEPHE
jgi:hypothetical protein